MTPYIGLLARKNWIALLLLLIACVPANAQTKKIKTTFGLDFGLVFVNFDPANHTANPIIQGGNPSATLNGGTVSIFTEFIKPRKRKDGNYGPGGGLKLKLAFNKYAISADAPDFSGPEDYKFRYVSGQLLYKLCLFSKEADVPSSKDPDRITLIQHDSREWDAYYLEGATHPGYHTVVSVSLFTGPQFSSLIDGTYTSGNSTYNDGYKAIKSKISDNDFAWVGGIESKMGRGFIDLSYQASLQSIYDGKDIRFKGTTIRFGFAF